MLLRIFRQVHVKYLVQIILSPLFLLFYMSSHIQRYFMACFSCLEQIDKRLPISLKTLQLKSRTLVEPLAASGWTNTTYGDFPLTCRNVQYFATLKIAIDINNIKDKQFYVKWDLAACCEITREITRIYA